MEHLIGIHFHLAKREGCRMEFNRAAVLSCGIFFESLSFGLMDSIIRPYMEDLGAPYLVVFLFDFIWALIGLTAIVWGFISDIIGKRVMIALGILGSLPLYFMSNAKDPYTLLGLVAFLSLTYTMSQPAILATISFSKSVGRAFASYTMAASIGWGAGSLVMGFLHDTLKLGVSGVFIVSAISWVETFIRVSWGSLLSVRDR